MIKQQEIKKIFVKTEFPVALDSPDHLCPWGTAKDSSTNSRFNSKLYRLFEKLNRYPKILDLGCAGGGFVKECLNDGCLAIGLEGSDFSKKQARAEWPLLGDKFLFTTDISKKFEIKAVNDEGDFLLQFDVITAWEVIEHLAEERLPMAFENIKRHLLPEGIVILSIPTTEDVIRGIRLHQTVKKKIWWQKMFASYGLYHLEDLEAYFNTQYVRGPKQNAPGSFHLILSSDPRKHPVPPKLSLKEWLLDRWICSKAQRRLKKVVLGI